MATKEHSVLDSIDNDLKLFIDFDMCALGRQQGRYIEYAIAIRKEYILIEKNVIAMLVLNF
jgi:predicted metal-dependent HD superfamily phosphohydrolase